MKLIVGLGNPGSQYLQTRHNIGFVMVDFLADKLKLSLNKEKFNGVFVKTDQVILAKPLTYMNLSGDFVVKLSHFFKIELSDILIIYDDMDYPFGKFAIRSTGSAGGHNGMKDIVKKFNTVNIARIKIGIGSSNNRYNHVLSNFTFEEKMAMQPALKSVLAAAEAFINHDINFVMNNYNPKRKDKNETISS